ncbi:hypothetical protein COHA_003490 [Chlorella ohadii]|uniref:Uncharacterized protein n=1 Tax=Chlorella ohadii TaxID=2649997 RepID=A0AAD5DUS9_9CHLO|nr:hypothetical protein COHA_003490 [Chlorella ohadii]
MAAALRAVPGACLAAASATRRSQRHAAAPSGLAASLPQQPCAPGTLRPAQQQLRQPSIAASRRRRRAAAPAAVATTGDGSSGGGEPKPPAVGAAGGLKQLLRAAYDWLCSIKPPKSLWRSIAALVLGGEALVRILQGKVHWKNTIEQLDMVGPRSLGVCLLTAAFVGMVFTIQFIREFAKLGLTRSVGGVLALALARELTPVVTSIIIAGRVGSAFAAELGTMQVSEQTDSLRVLGSDPVDYITPFSTCFPSNLLQVSEQTDSLRVLGSDPVDYLITPRVLACMIAVPILNLLCFCMGMAASVVLAETVYDVSCNVILDSAMRAISAWDVVTSMIKCWVFGTIISAVSCSWGYTTTGGAKGVGESTTSAVVISLVLIFVFDFALSFLFFQGQGDALKQCVA